MDVTRMDYEAWDDVIPRPRFKQIDPFEDEKAETLK